MSHTQTHHAYWDEQQLTPLIDALVARGWYAGERFLDAGLCQELHAELTQLEARQQLQEAAIGRGDERTLRRDIRGDAIHWLDRESLAQRRYLALMAELQQQINIALYLGLFEFEAHSPSTRPAPSIASTTTASAARQSYRLHRALSQPGVA